MTDISLKNVTMYDSFFTNVMNAVRFRVTNLLVEGPFRLESTKTTSNFISSNLLSINGLVVRRDQSNSTNTVKLIESTFISTPAYSLLVQESL